jgi:hypothetical protein
VTDCYLVLGFPRTGATLIRRNLELHFGTEIKQSHEIVHDHVLENNTVVVSWRRDIFSVLISNLVMQHTGEMVTYSNKRVGKFVVDKQSFVDLFRAHRDWYWNLDQTRFAKVVRICYEDLVKDPMYLFRNLGLSKATDLSCISPCPYRGSDLIINIDDLQHTFTKLVQYELH